MPFIGPKGASAKPAPKAPAISSVSDDGATRAHNNGSIKVYFDVPYSKLPITSYTATSSPGGITGTGATSPITVTGLTAGQSYTFTVTATSSVGASAASAVSAAATSTTVPAAPTIGTPTPNNGAAYGATPTVSVPFTAPATGGSAITGYTITSSSGAIATGASSPINVSDAAGTARTYTVKATNANGNSVASSASSAATPATVPQAPTIGSASAGDGLATVTYTAGADGGSAITTFTAISSPSGVTATGASPITVTGLSNGTGYTFVVKATNARGDSATSSPSNSVTPVVPYYNPPVYYNPYYNPPVYYNPYYNPPVYNNPPAYNNPPCVPNGNYTFVPCGYNVCVYDSCGGFVGYTST